MKKRSLLLNSHWDIGLNAAGNIATTDGLYCDAQNVANAVRLFTNDAYLAADSGIPHFAVDLGINPQISLVRSRVRSAAVGVETIADAEAVDLAVTPQRVLTGRIKALTDEGAALEIEL